MSEHEVELDRVSKRFEDESGRPAKDADGKLVAPALSGVSIAVEKGELLVVVGPSGCGKSTTLRIVAGLEEADGGDVRIGGQLDARRASAGSRRRDGVPGLRALPADDACARTSSSRSRCGRRRRAERKKRADEAAEMLRSARSMDRLARGALGRRAAARGDGPRHRAPSARLPVRRAALEPRRGAAPGPAHRDRRRSSASSA